MNTAERDLVTGVTRNKSDIKMESDPLAPLQNQFAVTTRTRLPQRYKEHFLCA